MPRHESFQLVFKCIFSQTWKRPNQHIDELDVPQIEKDKYLLIEYQGEIQF